MAKGSSLGLTLPARTSPAKGAFDIRSGPLATWVNALSTGNVGETTKQLYRALHEVNRHSHAWKGRFHFMETIRKPLHAVQRAISTRYTGLTYPLPAKTQQIAILSQRLHTEMAIGYMAAMEEMLGSSFLFRSRRILKVMAHRAMQHLNQSLLTAYQVYGQQQSGSWRQLHTLYAFAEAEDFHQYSIKDPLWDEHGKSSIARVYKQIALLATTTPYRLRQGEAIATHQALARWAAHATLLKIGDDGTDEALFTLHLDSDEEPEYRSLDHLPCDGHECRYIDTRKLVRIVQEEAGNAGNTPISLLTPELYKRLIHGWEVAPTRSERRNEGGDSIEVVIGMIQIHQLLDPSLHPPKTHSPPLFASSASPAYARPSNPQRRAADDVWNPHGANRRWATTASATPQQAAPTPASILRWQIINESVGGFRLAVPEDREAGVRVGEVLAVREEHSPDRWHLTEVRWIRQYHKGLFEAGLRIIASDVIPVLAKNLTPGKNKAEFQRGLLLPEAPERDQPVTILIPNRLFHPSEKVLLHVSGHQVEIVLGNAIQDSGSFVQFEFDAGQKMAPASGEPAVSGRLPFEKLWGQL